MLKNILDDQELAKILTNNDNYEKIEAELHTVSYVDDTYHCVGIQNPIHMQQFVNEFLNILTEYFNCNRLKLNKDKTSLLLCPQAKDDNIINNVTIRNTDDTEHIKPTRQIKILGFVTNSRCRHDALVSKILTECSNVINKTIKIRGILTMRSKQMIMESQVLSRVRYISSFLASESEEIKQKIYKLIHRAARFVLGSYCFKTSNDNIMKKVGWDKPCSLVDKASAKFIHRVTSSGKPAFLKSYFRMPRSRAMADISTSFIPKSNKSKRTAVFIGVHNYNRIPLTLCSLTPTQLTQKLKHQNLLPSKVS